MTVINYLHVRGKKTDRIAVSKLDPVSSFLKISEFNYGSQSKFAPLFIQQYRGFHCLLLFTCLNVASNNDSYLLRIGLKILREFLNSKHHDEDKITTFIQ